MKAGMNPFALRQCENILRPGAQTPATPCAVAARRIWKHAPLGARGALTGHDCQVRKNIMESPRTVASFFVHNRYRGRSEHVRKDRALKPVNRYVPTLLFYVLTDCCCRWA